MKSLHGHFTRARSGQYAEPFINTFLHAFINTFLHELEEVFEDHRAREARIEAKLDRLINQGKELLMAEDALTTAFAALQTEIDQVVSDDAAAATELAALAATIQGWTPGTSLTAEDIAAAATQLTAATQALSTATTAAETPPATPPAS